MKKKKKEKKKENEQDKKVSRDKYYNKIKSEE
jgi:hypothetical protein